MGVALPLRKSAELQNLARSGDNTLKRFTSARRDAHYLKLGRWLSRQMRDAGFEPATSCV
jgi:hypothetical protein